MNCPWLKDNAGVINTLFGLIGDLSGAESLIAHILARGQVLVAGEQRVLLGINEMAVLFSLHLEALEGVDVEERYAPYGEFGPAITQYGALLEQAGSQESPLWEARLSIAGVEVISLEEMKEALVMEHYEILLGRDFS